MRHVIMVIGHGLNAEILQTTVSYLDSEEIDFLVHWDVRYPEPKLVSRKSEIKFVSPSRVNWGTYDQISATRKLLNDALRSNKNYDYFHLISSVDVPLFTKEKFQDFFSGKDYVSFSEDINEKIRERIDFYWPTKFINLKTKHGQRYVSVVRLFNRLLRVKRLSRTQSVLKGSNWFSLTRASAERVAAFSKYKMFEHSYLADELFVQMVLGTSDVEDKSENIQAARYVDWKRGEPFVFGMDEVAELRGVFNTKYAFARKVVEPDVANSILQLK